MSNQEEPRKAPTTFEEAFAELTMTPEEEEQLEAKREKEAADKEAAEDAKAKMPLDDKAEEPQDPNKLPDWVKFPPDFRIPRNKQLGFLRFEAEWTDKPELGPRWCLLWPLSVAEEKLAKPRSRGDSQRLYDELAKQTIRLIDGKKIDWGGDQSRETHYPVERFWDEIGPKCRPLIVNFYYQTHNLSPKQLAHFFLHCFHTRTAVAG